MYVVGGCALKKSVSSRHWPATVAFSESSISTARYSLSPRRQSAICVRSLFWKNCTSFLLTAGGLTSFLPTAVTVRVTFSGAAAAILAGATNVDTSAAVKNVRDPILILLLILPSPFALQT